MVLLLDTKTPVETCSQNRGFHAIIEEIRSNYVKLGHDLSWTFLYTPQHTFNPQQKLIFLGLNPGGRKELGKDYKEVISCETGNAYLVDNWGDENSLPGSSPLQRQIQHLYKGIADNAPVICPNYEGLMNDSLSFNFCPYRSPSWNELANRPETIKLCMKMLTDVLEYIHPRVIITMDKIAYDATRKVLKASLEGKGAVCTTETNRVGWGKVNYKIDRYTLDSTQTLVVKLPHLSHYKIFSCNNCQSQTQHITKSIADALFGLR